MKNMLFVTHFSKIILIILSSILFIRELSAYHYAYTKQTGEPLKWNNSQPIRYYVDLDHLGGYTLEQTLVLLQEAMKLWENIPTAKVPRFEFAGYLPEDVNKDNYELYLDSRKCFTGSMEYCDNTDVHNELKTVVIFDQYGWLLDNVLTYGGASAVAGANTFEGSLGFGDAEKILQGYVVYGETQGHNTAGTVAWMAHEIGHLLGLHHTSLNQQIVYYAGDDMENTLFFPTMQTGSYSSVRASAGATLNPDDITAISILYPSDTFHSETAKIKGVVKKSDGSPMPQVNVIVREISDPLCKVYSFLTSSYCPHPLISLSWTCLEPNGDYLIEGLLPGNYAIEVEEIIDEPYSLGVLHPEMFGDAEFWNEGDQASEDPYAYTIISLAAGETRENVDIILNRSEVTEDRVKFIPLDVLLANFPLPATTACTDTTIDYAALIGKDEGPDDTSTSAGCSLIIPRKN